MAIAQGIDIKGISGSDPELGSLIQAEIELQNSTINLTAASNYLTSAVANAMQPVLSNIHCEGYPGQRFHQGQKNADAIEELAISRACQLFGADHANVQPYRCTHANFIASVACVPAGGTILGFACNEGGHYTTGSTVHINSKLFNTVSYKVDSTTHTLDYDAILATALAVQPDAIFGGDTSYPGVWNWPRMRQIADQVGAVLIADISQTAGLIAAKTIDSPVPHAHIVTLSTYKTLRGPRAALILCQHAFKGKIDRAVFPVCQDGTNIMTTAGIAASLAEAAQPAFATYCRQVLANASSLSTALKAHGYKLITGTTKNHACLIDLTDHSMTANEAARSLAKASILCNSNVIPFDKGNPFQPNGLRLGTPAVTTLGMKSVDMERLAELLHQVLHAQGNSKTIARVSVEVGKLRSKFASNPAQASAKNATRQATIE